MQYRLSPLPVILWVLLVVVSGCVARMAYHPSDEIRDTPADFGLEYESVRITAPCGVEISGWWVPAPDAQKTVLYFHGNSGNIGDALERAALVNSLGMNILLADYRGFGGSTGSPTEEALYRDADAVMGYLVETRRIRPEEIVLWGWSLGGAVAARTAANYPVGMLIVESAFTSMADAANDLFPYVPAWLLANHVYETVGHLAQVDIPTLVIHSGDDEVIPFYHAERLHDAAQGPKTLLVINGCHKKGFVQSMDACRHGIQVFINNHR